MYDHLSHTKTAFNIKTDRGGITDIEFIARYPMLQRLQLINISKWSDNVRIFDSMAEYHSISHNRM